MNERDLFIAALQIEEPAERRAYLDQACGGDAELRQRVEVLLNAFTQAGSFLQQPAMDNAVGTMAERGGAGAPSAVPGTIIGAYKLLQQIGEGGMGEVWMAEQTQPVQRKVALKIIKPGMDSKQVIARFEVERQALAMMDHPNIARVFDAGTTDNGRPFFVMELVQGVPITIYCDEHRLTPRQRLELFVPICQAIQHAHQKGIIHRDIKPSNVLVAPFDGKPVVKIIDFGVAKAAGQSLTEKTLFTEFGAVVGTLEYMSPEQAELNNQDIDTRSDIYALGVLLYELLTGTTPLDRAHLKKTAFMEMLRIIREEEPPRPSARLSTTAELPAVAANRGLEPNKLSGLVRGELDWIVMKALEKDRSRRYETANGLAMDVRRFLADEPVQACPPSVLYRFRKLVRRNRLLFTTALMVAATLLVAVVGVTWKWREAEDLRRQEKAAKEQAQAAERKARLGEAEALMGQARGTRLSRRPGQRFVALAALKKAVAIGRDLDQPAAWFDSLRNQAIAALALPDIHITKEWAGFSPGSKWLVLNDDFTLYALTNDKGGCTVRRVADDAELATFPELGAPAVAEFGSGRVLALRSGERFQLWDLSRDKPVLRFEQSGVGEWKFHPDGHLVATEQRGGAINIYDVATGKPLHRLEPAGIPYWLRMAFHPTEPLLAIASYSSRLVQVRNYRTGEVMASTTPLWGNANGACAWSKDGRSLFVSDGEQSGAIQQYSFDPEAPVEKRLHPMRTLTGPGQGCAIITLNPRGDRLASRGWTSNVNLFDVVSGQLLFDIPSLSGAGGPLHFDRTGSRLAGARVGVHNDRFGLWSVADGREYRYLVARAAAFEQSSGPAIHPAGRIAAIGLKNGFAVFDLETGRELAHVKLPGVCVAFDGRGNLYTNGFGGFFRWPVRPSPEDSGRLILGPPESLPFRPGNRAISSSRDGRVIAQCMFDGYGMAAHAGGWIQHPESSAPQRVAPGSGTTFCSVSPDGRWVAFGVHNGPILGFDPKTAKRVCQRSTKEDSSFCSFSRDGRWLMTEVDGGRLYAVRTWEPGLQLGPGRPYDTTTDLVVVGQANGIYRLVELATGRELARLEDPKQNSGPAAFTPDGSRLVTLANDGMRVWDLRRIREGLMELGLDWDAPRFAPEKKPLSPLQLTVELGALGPAVKDLLAKSDGFRRTGDLVSALAVIQEAHAFAPEDPGLNNYLAWALTLFADAKSRDAKQAVKAAKKAVGAAENDTWHLRTLGVACHFAGDDKGAVTFLDKSLKLRKNGEAFDYFPLAAAHHRLGNKGQARKWYDLGVKWAETARHPHVAELAILRADAENCLGISKPADKK